MLESRARQAPIFETIGSAGAVNRAERGFLRFRRECGLMVVMLWPLYQRWQAHRRLQITEADQLMAAHGDRAYEVAQAFTRRVVQSSTPFRVREED